MKLSVIIPFYNGDKFIAKCLDSLLRQDMAKDDYEIIVVDDGSSDKADMVKVYAQMYGNIRYIWQENKGPSGARNRGLSEARGEYVFFCDSDDFVAGNVFGRLYDIAKAYNADALFFECKGIYEDVIPHPHMNFEDVTLYDPAFMLMTTPPYKISSGPWEFILKRSFLQEKQLSFNEKVIGREDYYFFLELMSRAERVAKVNVDVYYWVMHSTSITHTRGCDLVKRYSGYVNGLYLYLCLLIDFKKRMQERYVVPHHTIEAMDDLKDNDVFTILIHYFRYFSFKENVEVIKKLKKLSVYPIHIRYVNHLRYSRQKRLVLKVVSCFMNIPFLWLASCAMFHCMPRKLRFRL